MSGTDLLRIWYVAPQRLCNFHCGYCVSIGEYAKSNEQDWPQQDRDGFRHVIDWIASQGRPVGVRLATLGEPFMSRPFLEGAAWLTQQPNTAFVELLTNGSMLRSRLPGLAGEADVSKLSLWMTHHHTEMSIDRFIGNARFAAEEFGCFVVVNALLFDDNREHCEALQVAAEAAGLRFNIDLGYDPAAPSTVNIRSAEVVPLAVTEHGVATAVELGARRSVIDLNVAALDESHGMPCGAGHDYIYIGIEGDVYRCSRYYLMRHEPLGNVLDPDFELELSAERWRPCGATGGCCNKEDFLNLEMWRSRNTTSAPSLGWIGT
jgi:MoaA/NifB/PqqE/SkfB family radical SAM enzyme